jgi:hypothetical protein
VQRLAEDHRIQRHRESPTSVMSRVGGFGPPSRHERPGADVSRPLPVPWRRR